MGFRILKRLSRVRVHLRRRGLSAVQFGDDAAGGSGHAADFLRTIEMEIIPFVECE